MINKLKLLAIINKYYLGVNESVKWIIEDNVLEINFMTPTKDVIGKVTCNDFNLEDSQLAIYDTKKLQSLISICSGDLLIGLEKQHKMFTKVNISDTHFNTTYALADPLLINKPGTVNVPKYQVHLKFEVEDLENLIKAKSAQLDIDIMNLSTTQNLDENFACDFIFGDVAGHNNRIVYQIVGEVEKTNINIHFNSEIFKNILQANKDMKKGEMFLSEEGLMKLTFHSDYADREYFMVRRTETNF